MSQLQEPESEPKPVPVVPDEPLPSPRDATGTVDDVDYAPGGTQILVRTQGFNPVGFVTSALLQGVLESALISRRQVTVTYYGKDITRAVLHRMPTEESNVGEIDCTACECTALLDGEPGPVRVTDARALGVLLTAIDTNRRVQELRVDEQRILTRVKVNVSTGEPVPEA